MKELESREREYKKHSYEHFARCARVTWENMKPRRDAQKVMARAAYAEGNSIVDIAEYLRLSPRTVYRLVGDALKDGRRNSKGRPKTHVAHCAVCGQLSSTRYPVDRGGDVCSRKRCQEANACEKGA